MLMTRENHSLYGLHELNYAAMAPWRYLAKAAKQIGSSPFSPFAYTQMGKQMAAAGEVVERVTKPLWQTGFWAGRNPY